jgi:tetratricopeptide (TPR) repeat protein
VLPGQGDYQMEHTHPKAQAYALKALELDRELPEPYVTLASIAADYWQWEEAEKQFKRALELNPNYGTAYQWYGEYLVHVGRLEEANNAVQRALDLDPTSRIINYWVAELFYLYRRYDEAITQCQKTLELDRDFVPAHLTLGMSYMQKGMYEESKAEFQKAFDLSAAPRYLALLATAHAKSGNTQEANNILEALKKMIEEKRANAGDMSTLYTGVGNTVLALDWLEKAYEERSWVLLFLVDPLYDGLRSDSRFRDLHRRVLEGH